MSEANSSKVLFPPEGGREVDISAEVWPNSSKLIPDGLLKENEVLKTVTDDTGKQRYFAVKKEVKIK